MPFFLVLPLVNLSLFLFKFPRFHRLAHYCHIRRRPREWGQFRKSRNLTGGVEQYPRSEEIKDEPPYVYNMYFSVFRFCNQFCLQSWFRQNAKDVQNNLQTSEYRSNHLNNTFSRNRPPLFCIYRKPDGGGGESHGS